MTVADGARLCVDLDAIAHNYAVLAAAAPNSRLAPVLKADAYGHGAEDAARPLYDAGARTFFVARLFEGETLSRILPPEAEIFVFDGCPQDAAERLRAARLRPVLNSPEQCDRWRNANGSLADAAVHIDTGLNRLGLSLEEAGAILHPAMTPPRLLISHLACSADPSNPMNARQLSAFAEVRALVPDLPASLGATDAFGLGDPYHLDLLRPGLGLFGGGPCGRPFPGLKAAASLLAPILQIRTVDRGDTIGYDAAYTADQRRDVAILAAGYADGALRRSAGGGYGWFDGARRPILGRISMDLIALDVTACAKARPGAWVELFGANLSVQAAAQAAGVSAYELLARPGRRRRDLVRGPL